jgi:hypothetical protein
MRHVYLRYRCALIFKIGTRAIRREETDKTKILLSTIATFMAISSVNLNELQGQVTERARWLLPDVAKVTLDSSGSSQIEFNPAICRRLGPDLCEYFRAHEYGHVNLRHLERGVPTRQAEREADIWAATNASPSAVEAARKYFENGNGGSRFHGSAKERAQRLRGVQAAKKSVDSTQKRVKYLKPSVGGTTTTASVAARQSHLVSSEPKTIAIRPTITYRTGGRTTTTSTKTRAPIQYSGGSRKTVVGKPVPQNAKRVVNIERPTSNAYRSYYKQGYVPKGGFNNPSR